MTSAKGTPAFTRIAAVAATLALAIGASSARAENRLFAVAGDGGRDAGPYRGPATDAGLSGLGDLVALPDGGFLMASETDQGAMVLRVTPRGRLRRVAGGPDLGFRGDGGPAAEALLEYPLDIALTDGGGFLVVDNCRVRRVAGDGIIRTVAGSGSPRDCLILDAPGAAPGDGGAATSARLISPLAVAAMPDGGFLIAEGNRVRRVGRDGTITTVAGTGAAGEPEFSVPATSVRLTQPSALAPTPDGGFLIKDLYGVHQVRPDEIIQLLAGPWAIPTDAGVVYDTIARARWKVLGPLPGHATLLARGRPGYFAGNGESARRAPFPGIGDVEPAPGGGVLFATDDQIIFSAPARTGRLGVAVARETLPALLRRRLRFRLTRPARVTVSLYRGARRAARIAVSATAGLNTLRVPRRARRGLYRARLVAVAGDGAVSTDARAVLLGAWLPTKVAAGEIITGYGCSGECGGTEDTVERCRRLGPRRVDCIMGERELDTANLTPCTRVVSAVLRRSGYLYLRPYGCRKNVGYFRGRPRYAAPARQAPPLRTF